MNLYVYVESCEGEPAIKIEISGWLGDNYIAEEEWVTKEMLKKVLEGGE